ncbi:MAG: alpha-galactosidase [Actinomyces ruminicola]|nr:alpha-galactosidase [Actinomyces ruminicola]
MTGSYTWHTDALDVTLSWDKGSPIRLTSLACHGTLLLDLPGTVLPGHASVPLVEVNLLGEGHRANQTRGLGRTECGARLRHESVQESRAEGTHSLRVVQRDRERGLRVETILRSVCSAPAVQSRTTVTNEGGATVVVEALTAACVPVMAADDPILVHGTSAWTAENRWQERRLFADGLLAVDDTAVLPKPQATTVHAVGTSTWTTDGSLPSALLRESGSGRCLMWQVEAGGLPWRWEIEHASACPDVLAVRGSGPTTADHAWDAVLAPGESVDSAPVSWAWSGVGLDDAVATMTRHRRALRAASGIPHESGAPAVIFNDYMNTLDGNPTTEALEPLIDAAAQVGAEVFCIDAGWYDDFGDWWSGVGEWRPATVRFGGKNGFQELLDRIRGRGMVPGIWLEPESIGVRSPRANSFPEDAFLSRHGVPVVENGRHVLDFRCGAVRDHLDSVVDRLVGMGVGMLKLDQNVVPGIGSDRRGVLPGTGLAGSVYAYREWLMGVRRRHPGLLVENCGSGALRQDAGQCLLVDLQSTSDQPSALLYPTIAACAPLLLPPEMCGNWAYPQPGMEEGELLTTLVTGLAGRLYLSGHIDRMSGPERDRVARAVRVFMQSREWLLRTVPFWPLGLPRWTDPVVALGLTDGVSTRISLWSRAAEPREVQLPLPPGTDTDAVSLLEPAHGPVLGLGVSGDGLTASLPSGPVAGLIHLGIPLGS